MRFSAWHPYLRPLESGSERQVDAFATCGDPLSGYVIGQQHLLVAGLLVISHHALAFTLAIGIGICR
jgi:hypothetical protein